MSKRFGKKLRRLEVWWEDSLMLRPGWQPIRKVRKAKLPTCHSIGYALREDKRGILLVADAVGWQVAGATLIPRSAIRKRRRLR